MEKFPLAGLPAESPHPSSFSKTTQLWQKWPCFLISLPSKTQPIHLNWVHKSTDANCHHCNGLFRGWASDPDWAFRVFPQNCFVLELTKFEISHTFPFVKNIHWINASHCEEKPVCPKNKRTPRKQQIRVMGQDMETFKLWFHLFLRSGCICLSVPQFLKPLDSPNQ